ncbi:MAG TPA: hypothetical protein DCZ94_07675 [Lentisphaeria bacterium]|nr:MAG: hypothetical protein A2X48_14355 [Lentisphaerae bacterium GWF2_49_21]HBC86816.1 hypothetical protein [Lentisphaeria bacterium]
MSEKLKICLLIICVFLCAMIPDALGASYTRTFAAAQVELRNFASISLDNPYLPIIALLGVSMAIATFYFPRFGLFIMLFFVMISTDMPVGGGKDNVRPATIRFEDIVLLLVSIGWVLNRAKTRSLSSIKESRLYKPILAMSLIIIIATIFGILQNTVQLNKGILYSMKRLEYFWIFFMTYNLMETKDDAWLSIRLFLVGAAAVSVIGIAQFTVLPMSELAAGGSTATAGFGRANTLADFYLIIFGVAIGLFIHCRDKKWISIYVVLISLFALAIMMTKSRGAYVSIPFILVVVAYFSRNVKFIIIVATLSSFALLYQIGSIFITSQTAEVILTKHTDDIKYQVESIGDVIKKGPTADSSMKARYDAWNWAIPEIKKYPLFGHGVGSKPLYFFDNQYVAELYDTGILGLLIFIYLNLIIFTTVFIFYKGVDDDFSKGLALGFMGGHIGILIHGITITNFYTIINMEAFWFILAIIMLLYHLKLKESRNKIMEPVNPLS